VGVAVGVSVGVLVGEAEGVAVSVFDGLTVADAEGVIECVGVHVKVNVWVGGGVRVYVAVGSIPVGVTVTVGEGV
jgi:hypothetical protein